MLANPPKILALDFDGVICDGLIEYFQTTQRTYQQIWKHDYQTLLENLAPNFYQLRPVIETGWEMPILLRALVLGISDEKILQDWSKIAQEIISNEKIDKKELAQELDSVRDRWIETDLESWLKLHRFYPGVSKKLQQILNSPTQLYIITTKEGRFVKQLLQQQEIELSENNIFGKESQRPKSETLRQLLVSASENPANLWFVEDRLQTLQAVQQQTDLKNVGLYLAAWGYNTQKTRDSISSNSGIKLLSLEEFNQNFLLG